MAYCSKCGSPLSEDARFCSFCGASVEGPTSSGKRKEQSDGVVHKCPRCGQILGAFAAVCPSCGYELRDVDASTVVNAMSEMLLKADSSEEKIAIIRSFPIPNTKEDVLEFITWASSNINPEAYKVFSSSSNEENAAQSDAWEAKLDQAYQKARIMFGSDKEFPAVEAIYRQTKKGVAHAKGSMARFWIVFVAVAILLWAVLLTGKACGAW